MSKERFFVINQSMIQEQEYLLLPEQHTYFQRIENPLTILPQHVQPNPSCQAIIEALKYRDAIAYIGKQAYNLKVVCIPARDLAVYYQLKVTAQAPCLIKTNKETQLKGYRSGKRSALFIKGDKIYRYKGCGNDGEGFIVNEDGLRGSHFFHTAKRQLYMTHFINQLLKKEIGVTSANRPICIYEYPQSVGQLKGLSNAVPLLGKYCCVFETEGDRRVGTHLISPLQILFLNILDIDTLQLPDFFKQKNRVDECGLTQLLIDFEMMLEKGQNFLQIYDARQQFSDYVSLSELRKKFGQLKQVGNSEQIVARLADKFSPNNGEKVKELMSKGQWIKAIETVLERVGWEMGQIKRIFCQKQINWGFFNDHGYFHCNAHLNNFVITRPKTKMNRFAIPLDFDLAFQKQNFINIELESDTYGQRDDDTFEQMLLSEYNSMEMSISGVQIMNFRYSIEQQAKQPSQVLRMARIVFRDTLVRAFRWGMRNNQTEYQRICQNWDSQLHQIDRLVQGCLLLSADFQT